MQRKRSIQLKQLEPTWRKKMLEEEPKQILIWRADLRNTEGHKCRTGKIVAQLAHASMKAILDIGWNSTDTFVIPLIRSELVEWLNGRFTKVTVCVNSEQELLDIYQKAKDANLLCSLIQDAGLTEFGGVPTHTAVAIGPAYPKDVNPITSHLKTL
jgi:PTH2 family peptidyl-tRNA hydrolase